jgi:dinuclear metal center YbgI/SA1388 family protein
MRIKEWIELFEKEFPTSLAESWDNVGLQVGSIESEIKGILLTLDVTPRVIDEAITHNYNFIVAHHPLLFHPQKQIDTDSYFGAMLQTIIKNDITVYAAHTNFDASERGLNYMLAEILQLQNHTPLQELSETEGLGRIGTLREPMLLKNYIPILKDQLHIHSLKLIGDEHKTVSSIALCGGSGSSLIQLAIERKADVYISGDITYHHALDAYNMGFHILDVGHNIEKEVLPFLKETISRFDNTLPISISQVNTNPYKIK